MQRMPHISFLQYKTIENFCLSTVILDYFDYELHKIIDRKEVPYGGQRQQTEQN